MQAIPDTRDGRPRVVIIGGGFGGLSAARALASAPVRVTLIDRRNHHLFQPLLYQVATAALSPADIAVPIRGVLGTGREEGLEVFLDEVTGVDLEKRLVNLRTDGPVAYDRLIVAAGSRYSYFGHDEWQAHAPSLKSLDDATEIRRRILLAFERAETVKDPEERRRLLTFVVVGGGPTGVEMAGAMAELAKATLRQDFSHIDPAGARIILVEAIDELLSAFTDSQSAYTCEALSKMGVEVRLKSPVEAVGPGFVRFGGETVETPNVFWCAGVQAEPVAGWFGAAADKQGRVVVDAQMRLPGHPDVFVIGDAASVTGPDGKPYPALAPVAKQQGAHVAAIIAAEMTGEPAPGPFRYRDWGTMATIGRSAAVGKFGKFAVKGFFAWVLWGLVHVGYLVGFRNRIVVLVNWFWQWLTYRKGARLITGSPRLPPTHPPRKLRDEAPARSTLDS
ncbi:NADH dehydrogenase [Devosia enhydra]|uniref:NADH:ubiquinone reductase (non-electrogenic) n=1 Tax=Devosia enhydra TaxID=665118 RepID=A0A1K2HS63_9HYPH|nr:NAD(P)/FAD-dependent oxidoreductase [Devosia enhydra]SFZ80623.1 NADH dehydrogenase [Devosia enhydra]